MPRRIITEEELREAAREVLEYELAIFDSYNEYPDHIFHGKFRLDMAALIHEVKCGAVKAAKYSMGFTFYAKQCIAAVLLIFTLSCIAMPETVLAGYHKLIEVIETVFEDYTEYRYRINDDGGIEETFKPLKLGYLPEDFRIIEERRSNTSIKYLFGNDENQYLNINQKELEEKDKVQFWVDASDIRKEIYIIDNQTLQIVIMDDTIYFMMLKNNNRLTGQTNLSIDELIKIIGESYF